MQLIALLGLIGAVPPETLVVRAPAAAPALDGTVSAAEYGDPGTVVSAAGARVWLARAGEWVYVAASIPDATPSWRDELAVLLDPVGDRTPGPGHDDNAWVIRRVVDSSEVRRGVHGRWMLPGDDAAWRLGAARGGEGWDVRVTSDAAGWQVELRVERAWLSGEHGGLPAMGFVLFDDAVREWVGWPVSAACPGGARLERDPSCWAVVRP